MPEITERVINLEKRQNKNDKEIAVLKNIAENVDKSLISIDKTLDAHYKEYMQMQGTLKLVLDVREQTEKQFDEQKEINKSVNKEIEALKAFMNNIKGRLAMAAAIGGVVGGIITSYVASKL